MKKLQFFIFLLFSSFLLSQSWANDNNAFNNYNQRAYDELVKKNEQEMNREMGDIKKIVTQTGNIAIQLEGNNDGTIPSAGPGAPGEPIPIDKYKISLFLVGLIIIISNKKRLKFSIKKTL